MFQTPTPRLKGFSVVELLTVVAVLGIIATIAITAISRIQQSASLASAKRNAQEAASLSAVANASGIVHVMPELAGGVEATLAVLSNGISEPSETGIPIDLKLPLSGPEIERAAQYLTLRYTVDGITMEYDGQ